MIPGRGAAAFRRRAWRDLLLRSRASVSPAFFTAATAGARPAPPPIEVALTDSAGRGVFATRPISSGELIHTAAPLVAHPSPSLLHKVCYYCLRRLQSDSALAGDETMRCYFCSKRCRDLSKIFHEVEKKADWSAYDEKCRSRGLKYPFMVKRLACMVISGAASADILDILQPASLQPQMISEMEEEFELLKSTFTKAQIEENLIAFLTRQWYINVLARIRINAFRIELAAGSYEDILASAVASVSAECAVGNAVYMLPSFYNHDCDPNAHIIWIENADAKLKALRDIEPGEELRICYIDASMDYEARQTLLAEGFGFQCQCQRCSCGD